VTSFHTKAFEYQIPDDEEFMTEKNKATRKEFATTRILKDLMAKHYRELEHAAATGVKRIAWCTSVGPAELLRGMGFLVYFPENHGAMLGASRMATDVIPHATAIGYSPDICSYLTSDIGAFTQGRTPLTRSYGIEAVPRPDVLVFNTNQCRDVQDWFAWYAREFGVPLLGVHSHRGISRIKSHHIQDIARQLEELIAPLEEILGETFDIDRLKDAVRLSRRTSELWRACLATAKAKPSPLTFFDATVHMAPAVICRGTAAGVEYYETLLAELKQRLQKGIAAVEREQYRLYWEGMPIWGKLRALAELFSSLAACVVASTYCNSWIFEQLDPESPFESMARAYTELFIVRDEDYKGRYLKECYDGFSCNGMVFHDAKTCPNNSNTRYGLPERLRERSGIPTLTINGDLNDLRCYSEEQTLTNIEAFIEQLTDC
jgi:benzoyl-CoA reductase/2-hydroxyglutaryl-CoA dehydratase subunit BcrC/BadD/HgdB